MINFTIDSGEALAGFNQTQCACAVAGIVDQSFLIETLQIGGGAFAVDLLLQLATHILQAFDILGENFALTASRLQFFFYRASRVFDQRFGFKQIFFG